MLLQLTCGCSCLCSAPCAVCQEANEIRVSRPCYGHCCAKKPPCCACPEHDAMYMIGNTALSVLDNSQHC